ncbi:MAG: peptidase E [Deltaproteobacteria bacterium]|nr:peptidase E [Deltaproteobacteria bacterium]MBW2415205.1 peptidase E [Deltaproteobacteria bacterium]
MSEPEAQIIAIGGGGFSEGNSLALDAWVLGRARRDSPRVAFVGTASGDAQTYLDKFYAAFEKLGAVPAHLPFFRRTPDLRSFVVEQDVIYVGGGNSRSMLAVWREWGLPELLREAARGGTVLAGISAGAICWFEQGVTDSGAAGLESVDCLGLLPGSCCPHYDGEAERRPRYHAMLAEGRIAPGIAIDDEAAVHFQGGRARHVLSAKSGASAYRMQTTGGEVSEGRVDAEHLDVSQLDPGT